MTFFEQISIVFMMVVFFIFHCTYWRCRSIKKRKCKKGSFVINKAKKKDDVK